MATHRDDGRAFATTVPGLGPILAEELASLGLRPGKVETDGRADIVTFARAGWPTPTLGLGRLRTAEDVFVPVSQPAIRRTARATAERVTTTDVGRALDVLDALDALDHVEQGHVKRGQRGRRHRRRVRLVVRLGRERWFTRTQLRAALAEHLGALVTTDETPAVAELWVLATGPERLVVGLRVPSLGARGRLSRAVERPGALHPVVAAAMLRLLGPPATLVDPCCGTGTIALEARAIGWHAIAGDRDAGAVAAARANGVDAVVRLDARALPFASGSVQAVATNLPFGVQHRVQGVPVAWYRKVLAEAMRVAPAAVVLAAATAPFRQALGRLDVDLVRRYPLVLRGQPTSIWLLRRGRK